MMPISQTDITRTVFAFGLVPALSPSAVLGGPSSPDVQVQDLQTAQGRRAVIPDVRTTEEYAQRHVQGTKRLPLSDLLRRAAEMPAHPTVSVICRSGRRGALVSRSLVRAGKQNIRNVQVSMIAWQNAGYPVIWKGGQP